MCRFRAVLAGFLLWAGPVYANETLAETTLPVPLVELFTSEGCSSCPAADKWMSSLKGDPALWNEFVPVAFHVDYWDKQGWKDRFSSARHTERQQGYARRLRADTIFTPAIFINGVEWRGWSRGQGIPSPGRESRGILKLETFGDDEYQITFRPAERDGTTWTAYAALLAFDLKTQVKDGENRGKVLQHDFTCVGFESKEMDKVSFGYRALMSPKRLPNTKSAKTAMAVWVSRGGDVLPVQAAGAYLPSEKKVG